MKPELCAIISYSGPNGEPLACGYRPGHDGTHAWGSLPTYAQNYVSRVAMIKARCEKNLASHARVKDVLFAESKPCGCGQCLLMRDILDVL